MSDSQIDLDNELNKIVLVNRIIVGALITGAATFLGLMILVRASTNRPAPPVMVLTPLGLLFAAAALAGAAFTPKIVERRLQRQVAAGRWPVVQTTDPRLLLPQDANNVSAEEATFRWASMYTTPLIVRCALIEGAAFFQCVAYLIDGSVISVITAGVLLAILVYQWPGRERIDRWVQAQRDAVEELRRMTH